MKYIVIYITVDGTSREMPFIFPSSLVHKEVYEFMGTLLYSQHKEQNVTVECIGAGECNFFGQKPSCSGSSTTLNVGSRFEMDDDLITNYNYSHGIVM